MTVRITGKLEWSRGLILAFIFAAPMLLAGCTSSPRTQFEWGVNDNIHHRTARVVVPTRRPAYRVASTQASTDYDTPVPTARPQPGWYQASATPAPHETVIDTPVAGDVSFAWPMRGRVISEFGSTLSGERNDGVNIAANYDEPIHAAADGTVSYSGNDLKSYGNLVLIRHGGRYVTAYAHADRVIVNRGDHVVKGQVIAYAGQTGDVNSPQLHFEIRNGTTPVNPRGMLGPLQVASR